MKCFSLQLGYQPLVRSFIWMVLPAAIFIFLILALFYADLDIFEYLILSLPLVLWIIFISIFSFRNSIIISEDFIYAS